WNKVPKVDSLNTPEPNRSGPWETVQPQSQYNPAYLHPPQPGAASPGPSSFAWPSAQARQHTGDASAPLGTQPPANEPRPSVKSPWNNTHPARPWSSKSGAEPPGTPANAASSWGTPSSDYAQPSAPK